MRFLSLLLIAGCGSGCATAPPIQLAAHSASPQPQEVTLSLQEVEQVTHEFHLLRGDMTKPQTLSTLGLAEYVGRLHVLSAVSEQSGASLYTLRDGHALLLYFLLSAGEYRVAEARLDDQQWRVGDPH